MRLLHTSALSAAITTVGQARPSIGLALFGCANRPAYRICVLPDRALGRIHEAKIIEELGVFDPIPNSRNEKLVALDIERIKYWIGVRNANISVPVLELLGLCGVLPIHPKTYLRARHNREQAAASWTSKSDQSKAGDACNSVSTESLDADSGTIQNNSDSSSNVVQLSSNESGLTSEECTETARSDKVLAADALNRNTCSEASGSEDCDQTSNSKESPASIKGGDSA